MTKHLPRCATLLAGLLAPALRLIALLLAATAPASAQDYPNRPVHILVGFNPGAAADLTGRIIASRLGQVFGQQFIVENKPGAGSAIAAESMHRFSAKAPCDSPRWRSGIDRRS
jgi:tripartite-type tricarboxylate transporter receptor subunit TctC